MAEFWEGALYQPGNLNSLQKTSATSSCQLESAFSAMFTEHTEPLFLLIIKRIFILFLYYLSFSLFLLPGSFHVHISVLFFCNLEGFYGKWFYLDFKDHSVIHPFQGACPCAQWEYDLILSHLVIFSSHQNWKIIFHQITKVDVGWIITRQ